MPELTIKDAFILAVHHQQAGRLPEAEHLYRQILARQPRHAGALHFLGVIAHQVGRNDVAVDFIRRAIAVDPGMPTPHTNLGLALMELGQFDQAIAAHRHAIALRPDFHEAYNNLGAALTFSGKFDDAVAVYRQAIALWPDYTEAHNNLGNALKRRGQLGEAIAAYRQAIAVDADSESRQRGARWPNGPEVHLNLASLLLVCGYFEEGWEEYEWRWKAHELLPRRRNFPQPLWDGSGVVDRTILLHAEQGLGDTLQFIRYVPLVARRVGKIIIECQPELHRLIESMTTGCQIVDQGQILPAFDVHCPLLSLPRVFGTTLANMPCEVPYLGARAEDVKRWQERLADHSHAVKVGLVWAGKSSHWDDRNRSIKLAALAPLAQVHGVRFFSLQKGDAAAQAVNAPPGMEIVDWTNELHDFSDTAALVANLDLVITVDTAVAHLAGAMGKPVWTLLAHVPDWRWLMERADSPWYPSMRLFRQPVRGDWESVIGRAVDELAGWVQRRG